MRPLGAQARQTILEKSEAALNKYALPPNGQHAGGPHFPECRNNSGLFQDHLHDFLVLCNLRVSQFVCSFIQSGLLIANLLQKRQSGDNLIGTLNEGDCNISESYLHPEKDC